MERRLIPPFELTCPDNRELCKYYPDCKGSKAYEQTRHHLIPRRLGKIAVEAGMSIQYQSKLKRVIRHPLNILVVPRCIHDKLDGMTADELPPEADLDRKLETFYIQTEGAA